MGAVKQSVGKKSMVSKVRFSARDMAQIAVFAALIAALGLPGAITVGFSGVPITLQTLGVILAGAILEGPSRTTERRFASCRSIPSHSAC